MSLSVTVKVSNIQDLSNARYCAGMGVEYLGFSPETINGEKAKDISQWITGVKMVLEYGSGPLSELQITLENYGASIIETNEKSTVKYCIEQNIPVAFEGNGEDLDENSLQKIEYIVTNKKSDNSAQLTLVDWENFDKTNTIISAKIGLSLKADTEERPGFSNFETIMDQLEAIEID